MHIVSRTSQPLLHTQLFSVTWHLLILLVLGNRLQKWPEGISPPLRSVMRMGVGCHAGHLQFLSVEYVWIKRSSWY